MIKIRERREREIGREYDQTWVVFDRDSFPAQNFNNAIFKARDTNPKVYCAWSNEAFELWYLLHFDFCQDAASRDSYQKRIEQALTRQTGMTYCYQKNDPRMYHLLKKHGNQQQAIEWAEKLTHLHTGENFADHNPCTLVYQLVQALTDLENPGEP